MVKRIKAVVGWPKLKVSRSRGQYRHIEKRGLKPVKVRTKPEGGSTRAINVHGGGKMLMMG